jgi:hypothetical protein
MNELGIVSEEVELTPDDEGEPDPEPEDYSPIEVAELAGTRAQMIYNYIKSDRIPAFRDEATGNLRVKASDAEAWIDKYQKNKVAREAKRAAKLQRELNGEPEPHNKENQ